MGTGSDDFLLYLILFSLFFLLMYLGYRLYEEQTRSQALNDRLDSLVSGTIGSELSRKGLFSSKGRAEILLEHKLNTLISRKLSIEDPIRFLLYRCGMKIEAYKVLFIILIVYFVVFNAALYFFKYDFFESFFSSLLITIFGVYSFFKGRKKSRKQKFWNILPQAVEIILRGIKAGSSIERTFTVVARESPQPLKGEFENIIREIEFGVSYERALVTSARRVDLDEYYFLITSLIIQRQSGGSLSDVLENIIFVLQKSIEMKAKIRVVSAEGRLSGIVLGFLPVVVGLFMLKYYPDNINFFYKDPLGNKLLYIILTLFFLGFISIRRIVNVRE